MKSAKAKRAEVAEIAVDRGPGGFSAVRRRVAVATALARALGAKLAAASEDMTPEEAAALPGGAFSERAAIAPLYAGAPNITISKKRKTWTAR